MTANNQTINGAVISTSSQSGAGITATGTAANPIDHLTIENCSITGFNDGILLSYVTNVTISNCRIQGSYYAGILVICGRRRLDHRNHDQRDRPAELRRLELDRQRLRPGADAHGIG